MKAKVHSYTIMLATLVVASACAEMRPDNRYRVWLPALIRGRTY